MTPETKKITSTLHIGSCDAPRREIIIDFDGKPMTAENIRKIRSQDQKKIHIPVYSLTPTGAVVDTQGISNLRQHATSKTHTLFLVVQVPCSSYQINVKSKYQY